MPQEQFDWSKMTVEQMFETTRRTKEEKGRRLAELPFEKKIEIVEKFNGILKAALREDDERRAAEPKSADDKY